MFMLNLGHMLKQINAVILKHLVITNITRKNTGKINIFIFKCL